MHQDVISSGERNWSAWPSLRRHPTWIGAIAVVALVLLAGVVGRMTAPHTAGSGAVAATKVQEGKYALQQLEHERSTISDYVGSSATPNARTASKGEMISFSNALSTVLASRAVCNSMRWLYVRTTQGLTNRTRARAHLPVRPPSCYGETAWTPYVAALGATHTAQIYSNVTVTGKAPMHK